MAGMSQSAFGPGGAVPGGLRIPGSTNSNAVIMPGLARGGLGPEELPIPAVVAGATTSVPPNVNVAGSFGSANELAFSGRINAGVLFSLTNVEREAAKEACLNGWKAGIQAAEAALKEDLKKANAESDPEKRAAKRQEAKDNYKATLEANDEAYAINKAYYGTKK